MRDKLLAGPTSRSYFTEALLPNGEKKKKRRRGRERETENWRTESEREGWREKEQRKMFPPSSTNLWMNNSISFQWSPGALVPSARTQPLSLYILRASAPARPCKGHVTRVYTNGRHYELSLHPKYRTGRHRPSVPRLFFTPFLRRPTPLSESPAGKTLVDFAISDSGCISVRFELPIRSTTCSRQKE